MDINPEQFSDQIKEKYGFENNTFACIPKNDWRDRIKVEIGDAKQLDFHPQAKLHRWDEVSLSFRLVHDEVNPTVITEGEKIKWQGDKVEAHFYDLPANDDLKEGGYEFEVVLKEDPRKAKGEDYTVEFTLNTKGLDFFYQPALTQEEIDEGANRPENVIGSYAVYASEQKVNYVGKKEYKTGKVGHIYRPYVIDANGNKAWAVLNVDKDKGLLQITIDKDYLDKAVFPIVVDPTFGYTSAGASERAISANQLYGTYFTTSIAGLIEKITARVNSDVSGAAIKGIITAGATDIIISNGIANGSSLFYTTEGWYDSSFTTNPSVNSSTDYELAIISSGNISLDYDSVGSTSWKDTTNSFATPTDPTDGSSETNTKYSIYATYSGVIEQEGFRWRDDDGSETTATWLATQDTDITRAKSTNTRLRTLLNTKDSGSNPSSQQFKLQYQKNGASAWRNPGEYNISAIGSPLEHDTTNGSYNSSIKVDATHYLNVWRASDTNGYAQIFTVNSSTYAVTEEGSPLDFDSDLSYASITQIDSTHFLVVYAGTTNYGSAVVLEVNTSTWAVTAPGGVLDFYAAAFTYSSVTMIDATHAMAFWAGDGSDGFVQVLTVNTGTWAVTAEGSPVEHDATNGTYNSCYKYSATHVLNVWAGSGSDGYAQIFTVDGSYNVSEVGTPLEYDTTNGTYASLAQVTANTFLCSYLGTTTAKKAVVLTVNVDTYAVTAGSALTWYANTSTYNALVALNESGKYLAIFDDVDGDGRAQVLSVSGTTVTLDGDNFEFETTDLDYPSVNVYDDSHVIVFWAGASVDGYTQVLEVLPAHIKLSLSTQFADGDNTTAQLTAPSGKTTADFLAGEMSESSNPVAAIDLGVDEYTEVEWNLQATTYATDAATYDFRVTDNGTALDTYTVTPQWTIGSVEPEPPGQASAGFPTLLTMGVG